MPLRIWNFAGPIYQPPRRGSDYSVLGTAYSDGVDTREQNRIQLGPQINAIDLSSVGGTTANVNSGGIIQRTSGGSEYFYYVNRGTGPAKLVYSTLALATTQPGALSERGTSIIVTKAPGGTAEMSFGQAATNAEVITAVAATGAADTRASNGDIHRIFGQGPDRVYGLDGQTIQGNVLTGTSQDMSTPAFATLGTYARNDITPTGFAMTENLALWCHTRGVLVHNAQFEEFVVAAEVPYHALNGHAAKFVDYFGAFVPLQSKLLLFNGEYSRRVGPEAYDVPNDLQGMFTAIGNDANYTYMALRNTINSTTYLMAARPRQPGDWHGEEVSYYCIGSFSDECEWADVPPDVTSERTNPTLILGQGSDAAYVVLPRSQAASKDSNYKYEPNTNQTVTGTEVQPAEPETIDSFILPRMSNLDAGRTVTVKIAYTDASGNSGTASLGPFDRSGRLDHPIPANLIPRDLVAYQPQIVLNSTTNASSPLLLGTDHLVLRTRPSKER